MPIFMNPLSRAAIHFALLVSTLGLHQQASAQAKTPERYYTAQPDAIINEMRETPRPRTGMSLPQLIELDKAVGPRALACDSMFNEDARMQERLKAWPRPQQVGLANECRRIIADYNAMQEQAKQLKQAEQAQVQRAQQEQAARKAEETRKADEARAAEQRSAFLTRRPDFLLVLNTGARPFEVTRALDGKRVINQKMRPVVVDFVRASSQSSAILIERYERLPPELITELKAGVVELGKRNGLTLETRGLEVREARLQVGRKCVGQTASPGNPRTSQGQPASASDTLTRVCPDLTVGLIDQAELSRIKPLIDAGTILVIGEIRNVELQARVDAAARKRAEEAAAEDASRKAILAQIGSRPSDFLAIVIPGNKKPASCSLKGRKLEGASLSVGGYSSLPDFARATRLDPDWRLDHFVDDLEKLWTLIQQGGCSGVIVTGAEAATLLPAFDREKLRYTLLPPREQGELHEAYAKIRGFSSVAQLRFAIELQASATDVKSLAGFAITDASGHRAAVGRMHASGYSKSTEVSDLLAFLQDEAEGAKNKRTAVQIRTARLAAEEARERERAERIKREMPLYSVQLMCMEPMGHMAETLVGHLARSPAVFIQMISGSLSQFCQQLALPVSNPDVIAGARLIASDASGAQYFVAKAPDGRSVLGLIKRRGG